MVLIVTMVTTLSWLPHCHGYQGHTLVLGVHCICISVCSMKSLGQPNLMNIIILRNTCLLLIEVYAGRKLCSMLYFLVFCVRFSPSPVIDVL